MHEVLTIQKSAIWLLISLLLGGLAISSLYDGQCLSFSECLNQKFLFWGNRLQYITRSFKETWKCYQCPHNFYTDTWRSKAIYFIYIKIQISTHSTNQSRILNILIVVTNVKGWLWHCRMGHASVQYLREASKTYEKMQQLKFDDRIRGCRVCHLSKIKMSPHHKVRDKAPDPFDVIHGELMGTIYPIKGVLATKYMVTFMDDVTRFALAYPVANKTDIGFAFEKFLNEMKLQFGGSIYLSNSICLKKWVSYMEIPTTPSPAPKNKKKFSKCVLLFTVCLDFGPDFVANLNCRIFF